MHLGDKPFENLTTGRGIVLRPWLECLAVALSFAVFTLTFGPWWSAYELYVDEGFNLGKAALVAEGFHPYRDIWNDQPPLLTLILAASEFIFPRSVLSARVIVLAFACVLVGALFRLVQRSEGSLAACFAILVLAGGSLFHLMSVSVLIGLPAVSIATVALVCCLGANRLGPVVLSGVLFGLALQTKFFVMAMAPAFLVSLALSPVMLTHRQKMWAAAVWSGAALASFLVVAGITGQSFWGQIVGHHYVLSMRGFRPFGSFGTVVDYLLSWPALLPCGLIGVVASMWRPTVARTIPAVLLAVSFVILANHSPVWGHQTLLLAVPLAWLSGVAVVEISRLVNSIGRWRTGALRYAVLAAFFIVAIPDMRAMRDLVTASGTGDADVMTMMRSIPSGNEWLITDRPIDAYRAGLLVPPSLVVFSWKRLTTQNLAPSLIQREIALRAPTHVIFRRFPVDAKIAEYLQSVGYTAVAKDGWSHFVLPPR